MKYLFALFLTCLFGCVISTPIQAGARDVQGDLFQSASELSEMEAKKVPDNRISKPNEGFLGSAVILPGLVGALGDLFKGIVTQHLPLIGGLDKRD
ncbi:hypothetical protein HRG_009659 [Hirsutella rhossiliensis]|uniref:Uncharacterized protein n=1 Tax=Hirsutella rhossiliensis TaxID=111463 RepID=A0A9P8MP99_9HYPO|nr:uncharacterized protein HRG_09659 [Hirsutella rhossiliensis]KAH0959198.1 hypothetical protein HRG_09659 [Hirsutella rhossiliensis]